MQDGSRAPESRDTAAMQGGGGHAGGQYAAGPNGEMVTLYGGLAYRWWWGDRGTSDLISGGVHFWQRVPESDRADFESSLLLQVRQRVAQALSERSGLLVGPESPSLDRLEVLVIWETEPDLLERLKAYEQGWSAALPSGTRARDLTQADVQRLARVLGLKRPRIERMDATNAS